MRGVTAREYQYLLTLLEVSCARHTPRFCGAHRYSRRRYRRRDRFSKAADVLIGKGRKITLHYFPKRSKKNGKFSFMHLSGIYWSYRIPARRDPAHAHSLPTVTHALPLYFYTLPSRATYIYIYLSQPRALTLRLRPHHDRTH